MHVNWPPDMHRMLHGLQMDLGTMAADKKLCREPAFVVSVLTAAQRALAACEASDLTAAIATGTGGAQAWGQAKGCSALRASALPGC